MCDKFVTISSKSKIKENKKNSKDKIKKNKAKIKLSSLFTTLTTGNCKKSLLIV